MGRVDPPRGTALTEHDLQEVEVSERLGKEKEPSVDCRPLVKRFPYLFLVYVVSGPEEEASPTQMCLTLLRTPQQGRIVTPNL